MNYIFEDKCQIDKIWQFYIFFKRQKIPPIYINRKLILLFFQFSKKYVSKKVYLQTNSFSCLIVHITLFFFTNQTFFSVFFDKFEFQNSKFLPNLTFFRNSVQFECLSWLLHILSRKSLNTLGKHCFCHPMFSKFQFCVLLLHFRVFYFTFQDCHLLLWSMHYRHCWSLKKTTKNERGFNKTQQIRYFFQYLWQNLTQSDTIWNNVLHLTVESKAFCCIASSRIGTNVGICNNDNNCSNNDNGNIIFFFQIPSYFIVWMACTNSI